MPTVVMFWRRRDRALHAPARVEALSNHARWQSTFAFPLRDRLRAIVQRDLARGARVDALFLLCRPSAILGRVGAVVVDTIETVQIASSAALIGRLWSHVGVKVREGLHPAVTDSNPACAVVLIARILRIRTALFDSQPHDVFRRAMWADSPLAVRAFQRGGVLTAQAATAFGFTGTQHHRRHAALLAAVAAAGPHGVTATALRWVIGNGEASKSLPAQVHNRVCHMPQYTTEGRV